MRLTLNRTVSKRVLKEKGSSRSFDVRFDRPRGYSEVSLPVLGRAGNQFPSFPDRLCSSSLILRASRRRRSGHRHGWQGWNRSRVFPRQRIGIGDVTSLMPRVRVTSLRVFLALGGRWRAGLTLLRHRDACIWSGDVQHPLDVSGLRPEKRTNN